MQDRILPPTLPLTISQHIFMLHFEHDTHTHDSLSDFNIRGNNFNHISHVVWLFSNMFTFLAKKTFFVHHGLLTEKSCVHREMVRRQQRRYMTKNASKVNEKKTQNMLTSHAMCRKSRVCVMIGDRRKVFRSYFER